MAKPGVLDVTDNPNGSISITATNRKDIAIRARVVATDRTESDAAALGREVKVTAENGRVRADGPNTSGNRRSWWVSYRIEVPASQDLELGTSNGSVSISGVNGRIRAESSNGSLSLVDVGGDVIATTSNGSVHAALGGSTWSGAGLELRTSNGSVRVDVPEKYNARLIAGTSNGNLSVDMPITVQGRSSRWTRAPRTSSRPPSLLCHISCEMTMTRASLRVSSAVNVRPAAGWTRMMSKNVGLTAAQVIRTGSPAPVSVCEQN